MYLHARPPTWLLRFKMWRQRNPRLFVAAVTLAFFFSFLTVFVVFGTTPCQSLRRFSCPSDSLKKTKDDPVTILVMNNIKNWYDTDMPGGCPQACRFTQDPSMFESADALLFHMPTDKGCYPQKCSNQKWIVLSSEHQLHYPQLKDFGYMDNFDLTMTFDRRSDIPVNYLSNYPSTIYRPCRHKKKPQKAPLVYLQSHCRSFNKRVEYVAELMKHIQVDSYGKCLHNKDSDFHSMGFNNGTSKEETISEYKFTISFENGNLYDYVTEKFFQPLTCCTVPVYMGAPNIADFAPHPHSYIDATKFESPKHLAEYLHELDQDDDKYNEYLKWKDQPPSTELTSLAERIGSHTGNCRLCQRIAADRAKN